MRASFLVFGAGHPHDVQQLGPSEPLFAERMVDRPKFQELAAHRYEFGYATAVEAEARFCVTGRAAVAPLQVQAALRHLDQVEGQDSLTRFVETQPQLQAGLDLENIEAFL